MDNVTQYKKATNWGTGYEGTIANNCRYLLVIFNIFKPKKLQYLQLITGWVQAVVSYCQTKSIPLNSINSSIVYIRVVKSIL